jgi:DNA-binding LytR/AlgR family response regulator
MFKLKVPKHQRARLREKLKVIDSSQYEYVLTTEADLIEPDKINIVFNEEDTAKVVHLLDAIVKGDDVHVLGFNEHGQKQLESRRIVYFVIEQDNLIAVLRDARYEVKMKLYEVEEQLQDKYFIRVSKYAMVNMNMIDYIRPALNSKLMLLMKNGDEVEVNRRYYKAFKKTLRL